MRPPKFYRQLTILQIIQMLKAEDCMLYVCAEEAVWV